MPHLSPPQVGLQQCLVTGSSLGALQLVVYCTYAASLYYGAWRVVEGALLLRGMHLRPASTLL